MRAHEHKKLFGSTWYLIGSFFALVLFSPPIAIASILFLNLGDFAAAAIGISYGNTKIFGGKKSLEGCLAMFFTCFAIGVGIFNSVDLFEYIAVAGALAATLAELIPFVDDNVTIPILSGLAMTLAVWRIGAVLPVVSEMSQVVQQY